MKSISSKDKLEEINPQGSVIHEKISSKDARIKLGKIKGIEALDKEIISEGNSNKKEMLFNKPNKCILCGLEFRGWGNNPQPLASGSDSCCDYCNATKVISARLKQMRELK